MTRFCLLAANWCGCGLWNCFRLRFCRVMTRNLFLARFRAAWRCGCCGFPIVIMRIFSYTRSCLWPTSCNRGWYCWWWSSTRWANWSCSTRCCWCCRRWSSSHWILCSWSTRCCWRCPWYCTWFSNCIKVSCIWYNRRFRGSAFGHQWGPGRISTFDCWFRGCGCGLTACLQGWLILFLAWSSFGNCSFFICARAGRRIC